MVERKSGPGKPPPVKGAAKPVKAAKPTKGTKAPAPPVVPTPAGLSPAASAAAVLRHHFDTEVPEAFRLAVSCLDGEAVANITPKLTFAEISTWLEDEVMTVDRAIRRETDGYQARYSRLRAILVKIRDRRPVVLPIEMTAPCPAPPPRPDPAPRASYTSEAARAKIRDVLKEHGQLGQQTASRPEAMPPPPSLRIPVTPKPDWRGTDPLYEDYDPAFWYEGHRSFRQFRKDMGLSPPSLEDYNAVGLGEPEPEFKEDAARRSQLVRAQAGSDVIDRPVELPAFKGKPGSARRRRKLIQLATPFVLPLLAWLALGPDNSGALLSGTVHAVFGIVTTWGTYRLAAGAVGLLLLLWRMDLIPQIIAPPGKAWLPGIVSGALLVLAIGPDTIGNAALGLLGLSLHSGWGLPLVIMAGLGLLGVFVVRWYAEAFPPPPPPRRYPSGASVSTNIRPGYGAYAIENFREDENFGTAAIGDDVTALDNAMSGSRGTFTPLFRS